MAELEKLKKEEELFETTELEINPEEQKSNPKKEFYALLDADTNRRLNVKAKELVKLGLFSQEQQVSMDFSNLKKITFDKKYRGLYDLYQDQETFQLFFVCPLVEDNKGDKDERKDLSPYAYDIITIENLDNEEYELAIKAGVTENTKIMDRIFKASWIVYIIALIITVIVFIFYLAHYASNNTSDMPTVVYTIIYSILNTAQLIIFDVIAGLLLVIALVQLRKFKGKQ